MTDPDRPRDWGNVRYGTAAHRRAAVADEAGTRFAIGMAVFLAVALAYPWYSYWVQSRLLSRDMQVAADTLSQQADAEGQRIQRAAAATQAEQHAAARAARVAAVRVMGASGREDAAVVIVDMGAATLEEARPQICRQAGKWLRASVQGQTIRVQRHRGNAPAVDVGRVSC